MQSMSGELYPQPPADREHLNPDILVREPDALSVIAPVKNEERNLPTLIERLFPVLREFHRPFDMIIVNDGSTDGSTLG